MHVKRIKMSEILKYAVELCLPKIAVLSPNLALDGSWLLSLGMNSEFMKSSLI